MGDDSELLDAATEAGYTEAQVCAHCFKVLRGNPLNVFHRRVTVPSAPRPIIPGGKGG